MVQFLDHLPDLIKELEQIVRRRVIEPIEFVAGNMYCPVCLEYMRMKIKLLTRHSRLINDIIDFQKVQSLAPPIEEKKFWFFGLFKGKAKVKLEPASPQFASNEPPAVLIYTCVQCETRFSVVIHHDMSGPTIAVLPNCHGGLSTPHTPPDVAYFVDQASKACSIKANSAALAMFRAALHQLLEQQGFTEDRLPQKLAGLELAIKNGTAPAWVDYFPKELLVVIKELGDSSMHPNEIDKLKAYDDKLSVRCQIAFASILNAVYEQSDANKELLAQLNAVLAKL